MMLSRRVSGRKNNSFLITFIGCVSVDGKSSFQLIFRTCRNTGIVGSGLAKTAVRWQTSHAVSYTHLDVYKRQCLITSWFPLFLTLVLLCKPPASRFSYLLCYTHFKITNYIKHILFINSYI